MPEERSAAFEIRKDDAGEVDEIVAPACSLHIERMSGDGWFIGITEPDGSFHQFWLGAKNYRSHVIVRHTESYPVPLSPHQAGDSER